VCFLRWDPNKWFPIRKFRFSPPPHCPGLCNLDHLVCRILLSVPVFSPDGMQKTLHHAIQCLGAVPSHYSLILWILRRTWKQPHLLKTPVIEWMESRRCSDLNLESNSHVNHNSPAHTVFCLVPMRLIKIPKLHEQCESWPLLDGFALNGTVSYDTRWTFYRCSGLWILLFRSSCFRFAFSVCNKLMRLKMVPYVISSMTLVNVSATPGIVSTRIGSKPNVCTAWPCGGVDWISERRWCTELCPRNRCNCCSSPIIAGKSFCARWTHSPMVFPHKIDSSNPITTFSFSNLHIIAAATDVTVFPSPISPAPSSPGISVSQTHLLTMNHMTLTWCARNFVPGRPGIEYLWSGTQSSIDWWIGWAFSSLTASSSHWCSNSLSIVMSTVFNTKLVFSGSRSSSPSSTCSWTSLEP